MASVLRLRAGENAAPHREMENDIYNYIYTGFIRVYNSILGFIRFIMEHYHIESN